MENRNDLYEYEVEVITDTDTGQLNVSFLKAILNKYASDGWRLRSVLSNEIGKIASSIGIAGISAGTNATIEQTVLIFERRVQTAEEIEEKNKQEIERQQKLIEKKKKKLQDEYNNLTLDYTHEELFHLYMEIENRNEFIYKIIKLMDRPVTPVEVCSKFGDKIPVMEMASILKKLVSENYLIQDESKRYLIK